jgi:putative transposase
MRKSMLVNEQVYHVFSRSIARYKIFNTDIDYNRIVQAIRYYRRTKNDIRLSRFIKLSYANKYNYNAGHADGNYLADIIAYCIMPTHIHLILKQRADLGISQFMQNVLNSYTRYFNVKHNRKGPLWESRFKSVLVESDEYLLHLTRYIHLNPVTSGWAEKPEEWKASSYNEYIGKTEVILPVCGFRGLIEIEPDEYKAFVDDRIAFQRELHKIKSLLLDRPGPLRGRSRRAAAT